jgi:hypothetical protein
MIFVEFPIVPRTFREKAMFLWIILNAFLAHALQNLQQQTSL